MAAINDGRAVAGAQAVENSTKGARVVIVPRTVNSYGIAATTGVIAAALAANSSVFTMRLDAGATRLAFIERLRIQFTCLVAFTVPITAGRRLALYKGQIAASPTGGTALAAASRKHTAAGVASEFDAVNGGDIRISTTGALTAAITAEQQFAEMSLVHVGAAGGFFEQVFEFAASESTPLILEPGQIIAIRNPVVMDAAGTWQISVRSDWHEALAYGDSGAE